MLERTTVRFCSDCVKAAGLNYADQIGGTFVSEECERCGKLDFLHEHQSNAPAKLPPVKGEFHHFSDRGIFIYKYHCERCCRTFVESYPEVSAPAICHKCLNTNPDYPKHPSELAAGG